MTINAQDITVRALRPSGVLVPVIVNTLLEAELGTYAYNGADVVTTAPVSSVPYDLSGFTIPFAVNWPSPPVTTSEVTIATTGAQAATDIAAAAATPGTRIIVPASAGNIGTLFLGDVADIDLSIDYGVTISSLAIGRTPSSGDIASNRIKFTGGTIRQVNTYATGNTDILFDAVVFDNDANGGGAAGRNTEMFNTIGGKPTRMAIANSVMRTLPTSGEGSCCLFIGEADDFIFVNNNANTSGTINAWGFRFNGCTRAVFVDNAIRVAGHKLIRFNTTDCHDVYVSGGIWMREASTNNDAWAQVDDTMTVDNILIENTTMHTEDEAQLVAGMGSNSGNGTWTMRNIDWYAPDSSVISDSVLTFLEGFASGSAVADYGTGTHTYTYGTPNFPADPWRSLPTLPEDNPDNMPVN